MAEIFCGSKLAYIVDNTLLVYKRDEKPGLPFPGMWDFPGGGREGTETPEDCALRELYEEFSLQLSAERLIYRRQVPSLIGNGEAYFFVVLGNQEEVGKIHFGEEGQYWKLMPIEHYLSDSEAIPALQQRLQDYLAESRHRKP